jgi:hypothetical protein
VHARPLALFVGSVVLVMAGCSATVSGHGDVGPALGPTSTPASPAGAARFARAPSSTAIGDPASVDLCSVVHATSFSRLGHQAELASEQYPPGCDVDLMTPETVVWVRAYATPEPSDEEPGRVTRRVAGQVVYAYPYDDGDCERDVAARGVTIVVETETDNDSGKPVAHPDRALNCAASDLMARQFATGIARRVFTRLSVATPSLMSMDACRVAEAAGWSSIPEFRGIAPYPTGFDAGCDFDSDSVGLYVDPVISRENSVSTASMITVGGHQLYAFDDNDATDCEFVSVQGTTSDDVHYETLDVTAHDDRRPTGFCNRIAAAFGRYLTTAGLR